MTYEIDLSAELYGPTVGRYQPEHGPLMTPTSVIISCAAYHDIAYYNRVRATQDYIEKVRAFFGTVPTLLSQDSLIAYPVDASHCFSARMEIDKIMRKINIQAIIKSWEDDGWVYLPDGNTVPPEKWNDLKKQMRPQSDIDLYAQVTSIPGGTRQQIADRYADAYKRVYGITWHPTIRQTASKIYFS